MTVITKYRLVLGLFMAALILSGVTAFPLGLELGWLTKWFGVDPAVSPEHYRGLSFWLSTVDHGLRDTYFHHPWIAYGTDWLAFAHVAIAVYFIGPLVSPVKNEWVIYGGLSGCLLVIPLAMICGPIRGIPFYWRLIDCSFGVLGAVPLLYCLHLTRLMKEKHQ